MKLSRRDIAVALIAAGLMVSGFSVVRAFAPDWLAAKLDAMQAAQCAAAVQGCICAYSPRAAQLEGLLLGLGVDVPPSPTDSCGGD